MEPLSDFVARWCHPRYPHADVSVAELAAAEQELGVLFPQDYRSQLVLAGAASAGIELLNAIVDRGLEIPDLSSLAGPQAIVEDTRILRAGGMPDYLIYIGSDCSGNCFCFDARQLTGPRKDISEVSFWDHDFNTTEVIAPSFSAWISQYLRI